jgi:hypothetical protein
MTIGSKLNFGHEEHVVYERKVSELVLSRYKSEVGLSHKH